MTDLQKLIALDFINLINEDIDMIMVDDMTYTLVRSGLVNTRVDDLTNLSRSIKEGIYLIPSSFVKLFK